MADGKDRGQRRVYVLPKELVERVTEYQHKMGLQSEVEAARRLLDEALKRRDDWRSITRRFADKLKETRYLQDIAKDVLTGHPLVAQISFKEDSINFALTNGVDVEINQQGEVIAHDSGGQFLSLDPTRNSNALDEEVPF